MKQKLLVVDDDQGIRSLLSDLMEEEKYDGEVFSCGESALKVLHEKKFDILLTDLNMPGMNGIELIKSVKKIQPDIVSLLFTGDATLDSAKQALWEGVFDYIEKPFSLVQIKKAIEKANEKAQLIKEKTKYKELISIVKISNVITSTEEKEKVLQTIINLALSHTNSLKGQIAFVGGVGEILGRYILVGQDTKLWEQPEYLETLNKLFEEEITYNGEPILISERKTTEHPLREKLVIKGFPGINEHTHKEESIIFPLKVKNHILGVMVITKEFSKEQFTQPDFEYLTIIANQAAISIENSKLVNDLEVSYLNTMQSLAKMIEAKSFYTKGHLEGVSRIALKIARKLDLMQNEISLIVKGASLHDVGKVGISESILNKPFSLTDEEYEIIKKHPVIGDEILSPITFLSDIRSIVKHHHERMDGKGYPDGLYAGDLPLCSRIVSVADACEAMLADRPYRKGLAAKNVIVELERNSGAQFDPDIVKVVCELLFQEKSIIS